MDFFGRHQWETFAQIKSHLIAKHAFGPGTGAVGLGNTVFVYVLHEIFVLAADGAHKGMSVKNSQEFKRSNMHNN